MLRIKKEIPIFKATIEPYTAVIEYAKCKKDNSFQLNKEKTEIKKFNKKVALDVKDMKNINKILQRAIIKNSIKINTLKKLLEKVSEGENE